MKMTVRKYNVVTGPVSRFMKIKKDMMGPNQPNKDFYVTTGHKLLVNGIEIKAKKINKATLVKTQPQKVYTICTKEKIPIMINGLAVMADSAEYFLEYARKNNIFWNDNKKDSRMINNVMDNYFILTYIWMYKWQKKLKNKLLEVAIE